MAEILIKKEYEVKHGDFTYAGQASSTIKKILKKIGIDSKVIRRIAIASYEAEMNLVIHSLGGVMILEIEKDLVRLSTIDEGPGIEDINLAMKEGYSTASDKVRELGFGAGMGLPNIKRCADEFDIDSAKGEGTKLRLGFRI